MNTEDIRRRKLVCLACQDNTPPDLLSALGAILDTSTVKNELDAAFAWDDDGEGTCTVTRMSGRFSAVVQITVSIDRHSREAQAEFELSTISWRAFPTPTFGPCTFAVDLAQRDFAYLTPTAAEADFAMSAAEAYELSEEARAVESAIHDRCEASDVR